MSRRALSGASRAVAWTRTAAARGADPEMQRTVPPPVGVRRDPREGSAGLTISQFNCGYAPPGRRGPLQHHDAAAAPRTKWWLT
ncbi:hypothetical protein Saso_63960 [Streptomyces asoensis]|uniref:Uncharacterized protein n=1 Tax=Streptomyces asoensis TaxID=249586 RepID=A0ABQ3S9E4_9ACTN|nr:hypothetical protein GCM10010496_38190 [Streptomyces asoensis]GHI64746.1 hypothetical protein Saso_63960 [Streptomyces asoensis]